MAGSDISANSVTTTGSNVVAFGGPTRLKGFIITPSANAGTVTFVDDATTKFVVTTGASADSGPNDVIQEAYDRIGGDPILGYDVRSARRSMNIMFSDWANRGYNQWTVELKNQAVSTGPTDYTLDYDTVDIINANIVDSDGVEYSMTRLGVNDYAAISNKTTQSRPTQFYLQRLSTPVVKIYPAPYQAYTLRYYRMRKI